MRIQHEIAALQRYLWVLSLADDRDLAGRYKMERPGRPPGLIWQMRWMAGHVVRWLDSKGLPGKDPWPVSLKHSVISDKAQPLVIWALGADVATLRAACEGVTRSLGDLPGYAPVLVTDTAAFAYFSRLGWMVEYLPSLQGGGELFLLRKARMLARLYRGAPAIPIRVGLLPSQQRVSILQQLANRPNRNGRRRSGAPERPQSRSFDARATARRATAGPVQSHTH